MDTDAHDQYRFFILYLLSSVGFPTVTNGEFLSAAKATTITVKNTKNAKQDIASALMHEIQKTSSKLHLNRFTVQSSKPKFAITIIAD